MTAFPDINDALVLVTDDHVFIGVDDGEGKALEAKTVDKVRRSALSVVPRYYKVHVTDDEDMRQRMTQIGDRLTNNGNAADYRDQISDMLREMGDDTPPRPNANNKTGPGSTTALASLTMPERADVCVRAETTDNCQTAMEISPWLSFTVLVYCACCVFAPL